VETLDNPLQFIRVLCCCPDGLEGPESCPLQLNNFQQSVHHFLVPRDHRVSGVVLFIMSACRDGCLGFRPRYQWPRPRNFYEASASRILASRSRLLHCIYSMFSPTGLYYDLTTEHRPRLRGGDGGNHSDGLKVAGRCPNVALTGILLRQFF